MRPRSWVRDKTEQECFSFFEKKHFVLFAQQSGFVYPSSWLHNNRVLHNLRNQSPSLSFSGGNVPAWLSGTLYRVGPGVIQSGDTMYEHLFDMPSVLHKISLKPGIQRFTYQNRIVSLTSEEQSNNIQNQMPFGSKVRRYKTIHNVELFREGLD